jgi:hypothetical protein
MKAGEGGRIGGAVRLYENERVQEVRNRGEMCCVSSVKKRTRHSMKDGL